MLYLKSLYLTLTKLLTSKLKSASFFRLLKFKVNRSISSIKNGLLSFITAVLSRRVIKDLLTGKLTDIYTQAQLRCQSRFYDRQMVLKDSLF